MCVVIIFVIVQDRETDDNSETKRCSVYVIIRFVIVQDWKEKETGCIGVILRFATITQQKNRPQTDTKFTKLQSLLSVAFLVWSEAWVVWMLFTLLLRCAHNVCLMCYCCCFCIWSNYASALLGLFAQKTEMVRMRSTLKFVWKNCMQP